LFLGATNVEAYIGPGIGTGVVSVILGFLLSIFFAIIAVFWYPLKRLLNRIRGKKSKKLMKND